MMQWSSQQTWFNLGFAPQLSLQLLNLYGYSITGQT
jgi:hypothetical protein